MQCATHPSVETELSCGKCGKAICPRCLIHSPVGARCRECAGNRRIPTYNMSGATFARAGAAAIAGGIVLGAAWAFFNVISFALLFIILGGLAFGYAIGEAVSLATNRKAGPPLQAIAVGGVVLAYFVRTGLLLGLTNWGLHDLRGDLGGLIVAVLAGFIAAGRLR
jgi:hypothetical protein